MGRNFNRVLVITWVTLNCSFSTPPPGESKEQSQEPGSLYYTTMKALKTCLVHVLSQVLKIVLVGLNYSALLEKHSLSLKLFYTTKNWNAYSFPKLYKRYLEDIGYTDMLAIFLKDSIILCPAVRGFLCYLQTIRHIKNWVNLLGITRQYEELTSSTRNQQKTLIKIAGLVQIPCLVEKLHCKTV